MRILVVEDEPKINELIVNRLKIEHYTVDTCMDGQDALDYLRCGEYDVIVLDIMLPGISGLEVLKTLRQQDKRTPVLLLTAKDTIEDRVMGLNFGGDDYLVKPFAFDELLARIRVMIRRSSNLVSNVVTLANLTVDFDAETVLRDNHSISLTSKEFSILEYLLRNMNIVLTRDKISQHIWNYDYEGSSNVVDVYIRYLRKKIDDNYSPKLIHTIRGSGYVMRDQK